MLVLSRKIGEAIHIDGRIKVTIVKIDSNRVRVGIEAPREVPILRSELREWSEFSCDEPAPQVSGITQDSAAALLSNSMSEM